VTPVGGRQCHPQVHLFPKKPDEDNMELNVLKAKSHDIRLVAFDLDGTLLKSDHTISELSLLAIQKLRDKGIKIAIASGRIFTMLETYAHALGGVDFVISVNGGSIDDLNTGQSVERKYLPAEDAKHMIDYCLNEHLDCCLLTRGPSYFTKNSRRIERFQKYNDLAKTLGLKTIELKIYEGMIDDVNHIEKILIQEMNIIKTHKIMKFVDQQTALTYTSSDKNLLDVSSKGIDKGDALKKIAAYMNIRQDQICAFGDYDNDVSMFEVAGISIAMGNASKKALDAAVYVTESNDHEGIAIAIKEIFSEVIR
jgi:Cof subfamily protein (haloacid dehalogenase superfamily)